MASRAVGGAAALGVAVGLVAVAVLVVAGNGDEPAPLPVLGAGFGEAAGTADSSPALAGGALAYRTDGSLDELGGDARAWSVGSDADLGRVRALAGALGLAGGVAEAEWGWEVTDGSGRLDVSRRPGLPWSYSSVAGSAAGAGGAPGAGASGSAAPPSPPDEPPPPSPHDTVACDMPPCPPGTACVQVCPPDGGEIRERPVDLPSEAEAEAWARPVLEAAGIDPGAATVRVDDLGTVRSVVADPVIDGLPTVGMTTVVSVGEGGDIGYAGGWLGAAAPGDRYPLMGTSEALRRLQEDRPVSYDDGREPGIGCAEPSCEPVTVTVTDVELGLQLVPAGEEPVWLVPSYLFDTAEGGPGPDVVVFAVADEHLTWPPSSPEPLPPEPPPGPVPLPEPRPVPPAAGESCAGSTGGSGGGGDAETPPTLEVCGPGLVGVGEVARFDLAASDPDSSLRDDCGSPVVSFGDDRGGPAVCDIGCVSAGPGPGELRRSFEHVYERPGSYEATFSLVACDPSGRVEGKVSLPVTVVEP